MTVRRAIFLTMLAVCAGCAAPAPRTPRPPDGPPPGARAEAVPLADQGYVFPIERGVLPADESLMPNADRGYRGGMHQGIDLYGLAGGSILPCETPVVNAHEGWVVRADREWSPMAAREYERITAALRAAPNEAFLDRLRGRQVWIRSGDGVTYRYCHLASLAPGVEIGVRVAAGIPLGTVGNTGTQDGARGSRKNCHLHFEIWPTEESWLGKGLSPRRALEEYARRFGMAGG